MATRNWREWLSKNAVRAISHGYRATGQPAFTYKIRLFHLAVADRGVDTRIRKCKSAGFKWLSLRVDEPALA
jgi:hypothetical protein